LINILEQLNYEKLINENDLLIKKIVSFLYKKSNLSQIDFDDLYQEACIALLIAYKNFDTRKGNWEQYLATIIRNRLIKYIIFERRNISAPLGAITISQNIYTLEKEGKTKEEILSLLCISSQRYYECKPLIKRELFSQNAKKIENYDKIGDIMSILDNEGQDLFLMYLDGKSVKSMADYMKWKPGYTRNKLKETLLKIKTKYGS